MKENEYVRILPVTYMMNYHTNVNNFVVLCVCYTIVIHFTHFHFDFTVCSYIQKLVILEVIIASSLLLYT